MESQADNEAKPSQDNAINLGRDMELVRKIRKHLTESRNHLKKWNDDAKEAYKFFAGNQWEPQDISKLQEEKRPAIVFNRIPRVINAVAGLEIPHNQGESLSNPCPSSSSL